MFKSTSFFILSLCIVVFSFTLFPEGMFLDGITYASISRNLSLGLGSFWKPYYTASISPEFYGHPPLAIFLQSIFFKIFGDYTWVERLYSLVTFILQYFLIQAIWNQVSSRKDKSWLPALLWFITGGVIWSYSNNVLENTNAIFISLSAYFSLKAFQKKLPFLHLFSGISLFLSILTKGPFGLFILSLPGLYFLFNQEASLKDSLKAISIQVCTLVSLLTMLILTSESALHFFKTYWDVQVVNSINSITTVSSRTYILQKLFKNTWYLLLLGFYLGRRNLFNQRTAYLFLTVSISGVLPIMISMKQSAFYIVPIYTFLAIGTSLLICDCFDRLIPSLPSWIVKTLTSISLAVGIFLCNKNTDNFRRDEQIIKDIQQINSLELKVEYLKNETGVKDNYYLNAYLQRYASLSLSNLCKDCYYILIRKSDFTSQEETVFDGELFQIIKREPNH